MKKGEHTDDEERRGVVWALYIRLFGGLGDHHRGGGGGFIKRRHGKGKVS